MPTYAQKHEGMLVVGELLRVNKPYQRKRDNETMLSLVIRTIGEDVPVRHECSVPASVFTGKAVEGATIALIGTAGEYNGSPYFGGYRGGVVSEDASLGDVVLGLVAE